MRAFVAIDVPDPVLDALGAARLAVLDADPSWEDQRWVTRERMHVTVHFLGDIDGDDTPGLTRTLNARLDEAPPFRLEPAAVRAVPTPGRARMLWASLEGDLDAASLLERVVRETCTPFQRDEDRTPRRAYRPHVTLCRARGRRPIAHEALASSTSALVNAPNASMSVSCVILYSSVLGPAGPSYTPLARMPLRAD